MCDYSVQHAIHRLVKDKTLNIWGCSFYQRFKKGAKDQYIKYTCRKNGKQNYIINLYN